MPENSAPGQLPRTVDIIVEDDLVDSCKPGDWKSNGMTVLVANNVSLLNKAASSPAYDEEDIKNIRKISQRDDLFELLASSLAPSIYGHLWIKKALILLMLGGVEKNLKNGTHLRGDINMIEYF
ncbi:hypothetical protein Leryth_025916 [Lithospermum erythrorhizon]|nr:hypothetical protein Leryth_025916 [Lithospermum erythrorhizon]